ncbi:MAG: SAP domain-containing protein [Candidatus Omnitrophica bacterium]|nr:SAP domain-containing protein [Candidatus Omnitrophota bacterium]
MKLSEIEKKARSLGIKNTWKYSKTELIREIQRKEGNFDCFGRAKDYCDQFSCLWRADCLKK